MEKVMLAPLTIAEFREIIREEIRNVLGETPVRSIASASEDFMNIKQASSFTQIAVATIYDYTHKKKIPFSKVGKKLIFSKKELTEWIKNHRKQTKNEIEEQANNWILRNAA